MYAAPTTIQAPPSYLPPAEPRVSYIPAGQPAMTHQTLPGQEMGQPEVIIAPPQYVTAPPQVTTTTAAPTTVTYAGQPVTYAAPQMHAQSCSYIPEPAPAVMHQAIGPQTV